MRVWTVPNPKPSPCLIQNGNLQRCSVCGYPFPADLHPSMSVAFAEHLRKAHKSDQTVVGQFPILLSLVLAGW